VLIVPAHTSNYNSISHALTVLGRMRKYILWKKTQHKPINVVLGIKIVTLKSKTKYIYTKYQQTEQADRRDHTSLYCHLIHKITSI
jgi:hypothetical protein